MKKTVGATSLELLEKADLNDLSHTPDDQMREQLEDYEKNVIECIENYKKDCHHDFFVVVLRKKERLMHNVMRNYFFGRRTCPTPEYDQTVYFYDQKAGDVHLIWDIPDMQTCFVMRNYPLDVQPEEKELFNYVCDFFDGTLLKKAKEYNNEEPMSNLIKN